MAEGPVVERGVLTAPAQVRAAAVRQAEVIGRLAEKGTVGLEAVDTAAAELGVSRRQVYVLVGRWRAGEGVVSDLLPDRSSGGRGGGRLPAGVEAIAVVGLIPEPALAALLAIPGVQVIGGDDLGSAWREAVLGVLPPYHLLPVWPGVPVELLEQDQT